MDNPNTKSLIKNGIKIIRDIKSFPEDKDFTIADKASKWIDLAIDQLIKLGEDEDIIKLLQTRNPLFNSLFPSFDLSQTKNHKSFLKAIESFVDEILKLLIQLKNNKETSTIIYIQKDVLYIISKGEKYYLFKRRCKREKLLKEILLKGPLTGASLLSTFRYKTFSFLSKEIANINEKFKLLGFNEKIIENGSTGYYINKSIKFFDQS